MQVLASRSLAAALALFYWAFVLEAAGQKTIPYGSMAPSFSRPAASEEYLSKGKWSSLGSSPGSLDRSPRSGEFHLLDFRHTDPDDPARHVGLGHPLAGTSWRNRPWYCRVALRRDVGDNLIRRRIGQDEVLFGGYRIGWDFDHYWGTELRFGFANLDLTTLQASEVDLGTSRDHFWDVNLLYSPWATPAGDLI